MIIPPPCRLVLAAGAVLFVSACERNTVQVYTAPKDPPPSQESGEHFPGDGHDHGPSDKPARPELPQMAWNLPAGWEQATGSQMNAATFSIKNDKGEATVAITPLANLAGKEEMIVNMWREQVGQEPLSAEQAANALTDIDVAGGRGKLFEVDGTREGKPFKIVTAMQTGPSDATWFYKLSGDAALVVDQKPAFLEFLKSVKFKDSAATAAPATASAESTQPATPPATPQPEEPSSFKWTVPEGWQQVAPGQLQAAKFSLPEKEGSKAEVAVSVFPSDTGGTLANVNRWLAQLGQPPVGEGDLGKLVKPLEGGPEGSQLVELPGEDKRIIGAIVHREGRWWFYKMTGGVPAVNAARDAFVAFAKAQP